MGWYYPRTPQLYCHSRREKPFSKRSNGRRTGRNRVRIRTLHQYPTRIRTPNAEKATYQSYQKINRHPRKTLTILLPRKLQTATPHF